MTNIEAINRIQESRADCKVKEALCIIVSEFDHFLLLKRKYSKQGLMRACYQDLGVKFIGLYGIDSLQDCIRRAEKNSLLDL